MRDQIEKRLAELQQAERETTDRLMLIRTVIAELTALLAPAADTPALDATPTPDTHTA